MYDVRCVMYDVKKVCAMYGVLRMVIYRTRILAPSFHLLWLLKVLFASRSFSEGWLR
jgi:hypothetical protein